MASLELFDTLLFVALFIDPPNEMPVVSFSFTILLANTASTTPFIPPPSKPPIAIPVAPAIAPPKVITPAKTVVATLTALPILLLSLYPSVWLSFSVKFMP